MSWIKFEDTYLFKTKSIDTYSKLLILETLQIITAHYRVQIQNLPLRILYLIKLIHFCASKLLYKYFLLLLSYVNQIVSNCEIILNKTFWKVSTVKRDVLLRVVYCYSFNAFECVYKYLYCYFAWNSCFKNKIVAYFTNLNNYNLS